MFLIMKKELLFIKHLHMTYAIAAVKCKRIFIISVTIVKASIQAEF